MGPTAHFCWPGLDSIEDQSHPPTQSFDLLPIHKLDESITTIYCEEEELGLYYRAIIT
jgi:hypothetical protein